MNKSEQVTLETGRDTYLSSLRDLIRLPIRDDLRLIIQNGLDVGEKTTTTEELYQSFNDMITEYKEATKDGTPMGEYCKKEAHQLAVMVTAITRIILNAMVQLVVLEFNRGCQKCIHCQQLFALIQEVDKLSKDMTTAMNKMRDFNTWGRVQEVAEGRQCVDKSDSTLTLN